MSLTGLYRNPKKRFGLTYQQYKGFYKNEAKVLSRFFDASKRVVRAGKLSTIVVVDGQKVRLHEQLGMKLYQAYKEGRLQIVGASFAGKPEAIIEVINQSLTEIDPKLSENKVTEKTLSKKRLIARNLSNASWYAKFLATYYDTTSPLQRLRALGALFEQDLPRLEQREESEVIRAELEDANTLRARLWLGLWTTMKLLSRISGKATEDFAQIEQAIYSEIADHIRLGMEMGANCESLIFKVVGPNGESNVPLMYSIVDKQSFVSEVPIKTLKARGFENEGDLVIDDPATPVPIDKDGNKYLSIKELDDFTPRRDYVVVVEGDGSKRLYRKEIKHGNDLLALYSSFKLRKIFADQPNAYVELTETTFKNADLSDGDIIPTVLRGTKLVTVAHAGENIVATQKKIQTARQLQQEIYDKAGVVVPLAEHPAEYSFGLVGEAFVKPFSYYIEDGTSMVKSEKPLVLINEAMRKAAAGVIAVLSGGKIGAGKIPETFFVGGANRTNIHGDYVVSGVVETPAPEVTPEDIDRQKLMGRFHNGLMYTTLVAAAERSISKDKGELAFKKLFIPPFLLKAFESGDFEVLKGAFRHTSVGFIDLKSSTALCAAFAKRGRADDYRKLINKLMTKLKEEVEAQKIDVVLLKFIGDCIMFVTGIPYEGESDHGNIIRAAIAMKRAVFKLNLDPEVQAIYKKHKDLFTDEQGRPTSARFCTGIMSGEVFAGDILHKSIDYRAFLTGQFLFDHQIVYDLIGDPVNVAARLEAAADAWHLVVNMTTIVGAKREGSLQEIVDEFNARCTKIDELRDRFLIPYYEKNGISYNLDILNSQLASYLEKFSPITIEDLITPFVVQGRGTGIEHAAYFRWDLRPIVLERLRAAGVEVPKDSGETVPPTITDILARDYSAKSLDQITLAKLREYGKYVKFAYLRVNAELIAKDKIRRRVLRNIDLAEGELQS